jgi:hypothetical protein
MAEIPLIPKLLPKEKDFIRTLYIGRINRNLRRLSPRRRPGSNSPHRDATTKLSPGLRRGERALRVLHHNNLNYWRGSPAIKIPNAAPMSVHSCAHGNRNHALHILKRNRRAKSATAAPLPTRTIAARCIPAFIWLSLPPDSVQMIGNPRRQRCPATHCAEARSPLPARC